jgi:hypothetical protein
MMFNEAPSGSGGGEVEVKERLKKPSRAERIEAWRKEHQAEYNRACSDSNCRCSATKAEALIMEQFNHPPID